LERNREVLLVWPEGENVVDERHYVAGEVAGS
jgi:hypothetical protein